jgi:curved DNA-binding protein
MKYKDYYAVLGVARDATLEDIKKAYRLLAKAHHPDMSNAAGAEERFKEAAEAYGCLKNPEKRAAYDALGRVPEGQGFTPSSEWENHFASGQHDFNGLDLSDLLASLNARQQGHAFSNAPRNGQDHQDSVRVSLLNALKGCTMNFSLQGSGEGKHIEVKIPAGIRQGQKIRLRGMGGTGHNGGRNGDMFLNVELLPDPLFKSIGNDLYLELGLSPWEAVLGAEIEIPTLGGSVMLTLAPGTRSGQKLRIKGQGLPSALQQRGDQYAVVHLETPQSVSEEERLHYQALAASFTAASAAGSTSASSFDPRPNITLTLNHERHHAHPRP